MADGFLRRCDMLNFFYYFLLVLFILVSGILILLVLLQRGKGGGLSGAFGGGGGGNTAFGAKTGDVLTWATSIIFGVFLLLAIGLNLVSDHRQAAFDAQLKERTSLTATSQVPTQTPVAPPEQSGQ